LILISNDDSINAKGLHSLIEVMRSFGKVVVVAPDRVRSAQSHAVTVEIPLTLTHIRSEENLEIYTCSGTPADCVKMAMFKLLKRKPDLIVSGINHGLNASVNVIYSGTMAVVIEGCMHGIPSIGFSLGTYNPDADFAAAKVIVSQIVEKTLTNKLPHWTCLNVNIPNKPLNELKGIRICRITKGAWAENFVVRKHPIHKHDYFWLAGRFVSFEKNVENPIPDDMGSVANDFVSVTPIYVDFTAYRTIETLEKWNLSL